MEPESGTSREGAAERARAARGERPARSSREPRGTPPGPAARSHAVDRVLADASTDAVAIHDRGTILAVNRAFCELFRCGEAEAVGHTVLDFVAPESHPTVMDAIAGARPSDAAGAGPTSAGPTSAGPAGAGQYVAQARDGTRFLAEVRSHGARYEERAVRVAVVRDVTAAREREERLRVLSRAAEAASNGIVVAGPREEDNPMRYANSAFERMTGYRWEEMVGRNCRFLQGAGTDPRAVRELREAIRDGRETRTTLLNYRRDGTPFWNEVYLSPVRDEDGDIPYWVGIMHDVTDRVRWEDEVRHLNRTLEERVRARTADLRTAYDELEAFSHSVSHDLRAPLRSIGYYARALDEDFGDALDPEARTYTSRIRAESEHVANLVTDLLALSRATRADLQRQRVDVSAIARGVADALRRAEPHREVEVEVADGLVANADPRLLRVALENLLGNAWKFTSKRDVGRIEVGAADVGGERAFFVRDDGVGFDPARAADIFAPFRRLDSARGFEGTGIGLATVARIARRHGGRVWAEGEPGKGATFWFTLAPPG